MPRTRLDRGGRVRSGKRNAMIIKMKFKKEKKQNMKSLQTGIGQKNKKKSSN
jgi:hypothetical protein